MMSMSFRPVIYVPRSRTGVTCFASDFGRILVVVGRQMVSLVSVHGRSSLFDICSLLHFSLVPVGFTGQYFSVLHGH